MQIHLFNLGAGFQLAARKFCGDFLTQSRQINGKKSSAGPPQQSKIS